MGASDLSSHTAPPPNLDRNRPYLEVRNIRTDPRTLLPIGGGVGIEVRLRRERDDALPLGTGGEKQTGELTCSARRPERKRLMIFISENETRGERVRGENVSRGGENEKRTLISHDEERERDEEREILISLRRSTRKSHLSLGVQPTRSDTSRSQRIFTSRPKNSSRSAGDLHDLRS